MRFSNKLAKALGIAIAEDGVKTFVNPVMCGSNFTWKWFYKEYISDQCNLHVHLNTTTKNWRKYVPIAIKSAQSRCKTLFEDNKIVIEPWYVYLLLCSDNTLYCGITNNIEKRLAKHNSGNGAKYTRGRLPVKLLKSFEVDSKSAALKMEHKIKKLSRTDKLNYNGQEK